MHCWFPMMHGMVKVPGSLHFGGMLGGTMADIFLPMLTFSFPFSLLLWVHKSLRNLAYFGICLIASRSGILTSTFLKVSIISLSNSTSAIFLFCVTLYGKGSGMFEEICLLLLFLDDSASLLIGSASSSFLQNMLSLYRIWKLQLLATSQSRH